MNLKRFLRHGWTGPRHLRRAFPKAVIARIEQAVAEAERKTTGQIRFAVEGELSLRHLWIGVAARERAIQVFSELRVWDTQQNSGVLIYLLLADHDVEIVSDRGIANCVTQDGWESVCRRMETEFRAGRFEHGALAGIQAVGQLLAQHFPLETKGGNELPDTPVIIR